MQAVAQDAVFARSDVISLHLAYATAKHSIIGRNAISGMKPGALAPPPLST
ncbi:MAG: hypothetical protein EON55_09600 [Alphaproteobacteria bacterium]|nr:MAG: hypothetical protein EON55_09600 [Alphaproteobacteria bacterium]